MNIDIGKRLKLIEESIKDVPVPVVDLIAVQTKDPFKVLTATILSARTRDETTAAAAKRLFSRASNAGQLAGLSVKEIEKLIYPVGFFRNKAGYLARLPAALEPYNGRVPDTIEELITLPGVGRKTANLVLGAAFGKPAICVDTHVHRIMNIWGYVQTKTPLATEMALRDKLPRRHWIEVNSILVAFGQSICRPVSPLCGQCPASRVCPQNHKKSRKIKMQKNKTALKLMSWNVNGIRAIEKKGFIEQVKEFDADILGIQETKAQPDQLSEQLKNIDGYKAYWFSAEKKGYSGVALYCKKEPLKVYYGMNVEEFDAEGRVITAEYDDYFLVNAYFPNSGAKLKRLDFKLRFNREIHQYLDRLADQKAVVLCGDYNVAHTEIDLKNPKNNVKNAGFTPEERAWMDEFVEAGYLDTFRMFNQEPGHYTWWSYRFNARAKDVGWRIDYFCVDGASKKKVISSQILKEVMGSDHCPVQMEFDPNCS